MKIYVLFIIAFLLCTQVLFGQILPQTNRIAGYLQSGEASPLRISDTSGIQTLGRWAWGSAKAIALTGQMALVGQGSDYQVYDLTNPDNPQLLYDSIMSVNEKIEDIKLNDTLLFILLSKTTLICDARQLYPLRELGRFDLRLTPYYPPGGYILRDMAVSDSLLYLMGFQLGVMTVNISNLQEPFFRGFFPLGKDNPSAIASKGRFIYYGALGPFWQHLYVLEFLSDSLSYRQKNLYVNGNAQAITLQDTLLFMSNNDGTIHFYSISDPWNPLLLTTLEAGNPVFEMTSVGTHLFCSTRDSGMTVVDITNPWYPFIAQRSSQLRWAEKLSATDSLLATASTLGCQFYKVTQDSANRIIQGGYFRVGGNYYGIAMKGSLALLASGSAGLWSVDFTDPSHPRPISNIPVAYYALDVVLSHSLAFVLCPSATYLMNDTVVIVQVDTLTGTLTKLTNLVVDDNTTSIAVKDSLLFVGSDSGVGIYSVSNSLLPYEINYWSIAGRYKQFSMEANLLAVTMRVFNEGLYILDVTNPRLLQQLSYLPMDLVAVLLEDTLVYVVATDLRIYSVSNPSAPFYLGSSASPCNCSSAKLHKGGAYLYLTL